ncbi:MAG: GvpL/GvpF family gas vesicle protein [Planctomycetes bacterium]|nr:GvpL/GvpF family gas vesicle protein [Planctomycetota bacterium]
MECLGIYLYGLTRSSLMPPLDGQGVDERFALERHDVQDVSAVVSRVTLEEFCGSSAEQRLQDLSWVAPRACRHEEVLRQVMRYAPVLPARFGTLFSSWPALERLLADHQETIVQFLERVSGREEWGVRGRLDRTLARTSLDSPAPGDSGEPLETVSAGRRYLHEKRRQACDRRDLSSWVRQVLSESATRLKAYAPDFCERRTVSAVGAGKEVIANWAFLLPSGAVPGFQEEVARLNADQGPRGLYFEITGPWPPFSFSPSFPVQKCGSASEPGN